MRKTTLIFCLALICTASPTQAGEDSNLFNKGKKFARTNQIEFAYMQFRDIINNFPNSPHREQAIFATGEYYAAIPDHQETKHIFEQFLAEYPESKSKIFALAHLYKIAELEEDAEKIEKLKTDIITIQQVGFVFRNSKELEYQSPLNHHYRAVIQIDRILIEKEGETLVELSY